MADVTKQVVCRQVLATTTSGATPIFLGGVKRVILRTLTNDIYLDIDQPIAPTMSYRLSSANTADTLIELEMGLITNIYVQAVTGSSQVYIIAIAG